ncbi:rRNA maturation RNase YbeY [Patescibacteria group bacterium]|nr:rRNA maturation RNase YbeY [Patescibacteria group bacterium]MDE1946329.1 rRNA maturation RNase YbeY [Patescibacteria group bacterium]MDE2010781.1 rRNA maturation RNase YbeY [Patescibacteria group bacterium]MDE2232666.1 rRNA maturation RNase YbeY [Patescibacteria group bacterium]
MNLSVTNETLSVLPVARSVLEKIKELVLGKGYELTLVVTGSATLKKFNLEYRNLNKTTDILSFPLSERQGEIYLCPSETRRQARLFGKNYRDFFIQLFIHGCAHLKGYRHGARMESFECKIWRATSSPVSMSAPTIPRSSSLAPKTKMRKVIRK